MLYITEQKDFMRSCAKEPLFKRLLNLVISPKIITTMRVLAEEDQEIESAIHLPDRDEIITIIDHALENSIYEPYVLLQKRVL